MLVTIRADASTEIGSGHVMRCLTLAERLRANGAAVSFACRSHAGDLVEKIRASGFAVDILPDRHSPVPESGSFHASWLGADWQDDADDTIAATAARHGQADWVIVDHYAIDARWEQKVRSAGRRVLVIDDLANRPHDCDLLLDQNVATPLQSRYDTLLNPPARKLLGLKFLLLREEFSRQKLSIDRPSRKALVFFGGSDPSGITLKLLEILPQTNVDLQLCVLVGSTNPKREAIEALCKAHGHEFHANASNVAELIAGCGLAIAACGFFAYELMALRTPALLTAQSDIQWTVAKALEELGVAVALSSSDLLQKHLLEEGIACTLKLSRQAEAFDLVSGNGAENVVSEMKRLDDDE